MKEGFELESRVMNLERKVRAGRMAGGVMEMKLCAAVTQKRCQISESTSNDDDAR